MQKKIIIISQFYLRNFSNAGKSIGMFINKKKLYIKQASIKASIKKKFIWKYQRY